MSHTIQFPNGQVLEFVTLTIVNYTNGGETVAASELPPPLASVDAVFFGQIPPSKNSLAVPLFPILEGGKIKLFQFVSGSPVEIPTTSALNAIIPCLVHAASVI